MMKVSLKKKLKTSYLNKKLKIQKNHRKMRNREIGKIKSMQNQTKKISLWMKIQFLKKIYSWKQTYLKKMFQKIKRKFQSKKSLHKRKNLNKKINLNNKKLLACFSKKRLLRKIISLQKLINSPLTIRLQVNKKRKRSKEKLQMCLKSFKVCKRKKQRATLNIFSLNCFRKRIKNQSKVLVH